MTGFPSNSYHVANRTAGHKNPYDEIAELRDVIKRLQRRIAELEQLENY